MRLQRAFSESPRTRRTRFGKPPQEKRERRWGAPAACPFHSSPRFSEREPLYGAKTEGGVLGGEEHAPSPTPPGPRPSTSSAVSSKTVFSFVEDVKRKGMRRLSRGRGHVSIESVAFSETASSRGASCSSRPLFFSLYLAAADL